MSKILLSCGHEDELHPQGWTVSVKEEGCDAVEGYYPRVSHYSYCSSCFAKALLSYPKDLCSNKDQIDHYFESYYG